jgi:hypothetical protein
MMLVHSSVRRLCVPLAIAVVMPFALHAQERVLGTWNGRVDKEVQITIRGNNVSSNTLSGQQLNGRFRLASALPRRDGTVRIAVTNGRGNVSVVQQPSSSNGYTSIIRLMDRGGGADAYRVTAYWTPASTGSGGRGVLPGRGAENGTENGRGNGRENGRRNGRNGMAAGALLHWSGDVDADAEIRWRPGTVTQRNLSGAALRNQRASVSGNVTPGSAGQITLNVRQGRGSVEVIQQPAANNRWTAVIRVRDPQGGYGHYDIDATWR